MKKIDEKFFETDPMTINTIEQLIDKDEKILWRGQPNRKAYIWSQVLSMLPIALIWLAFDSIFIGTMIAFGGQMPTIAIVFVCVFMLFHLTPVWIWMVNALIAGKRHKNIDYAFTDKRIIVRSGLVVDFVSVYYADINSVNVKVGIMDKLLKVGDIYIKSNSQAVVLNDLNNPYVIGNKLQQIANDIKADIHYPNNLRPDTNDGYNTKYNPKEK